jgi:hypothetical protein
VAVLRETRIPILHTKMLSIQLKATTRLARASREYVDRRSFPRTFQMMEHPTDIVNPDTNVQKDTTKPFKITQACWIID